MKITFIQIRKALVAGAFFFGLAFGVQAQPIKQFSSEGFSVNDGLLANRIVDIAEDKAGFIWLSFGAGLQRFNGDAFETIHPGEGLPETNHPRFFRLRNGDLWLSYHSGVSRYNSVTGKFQQIYQCPVSILQKLHPEEPYKMAPVMPVLETRHFVWCWCTAGRRFLAIDKSTGKITGMFAIGQALPGIKYFKSNGDSTLLVSYDDGIAEVDPSANKIRHLYHFPRLKKLVYDFFPLKQRQLLLATRKGIMNIDLSHGSHSLLCHYPPDVDTASISGINMNALYDSLVVIAINNRLYLFNARSGQFLYRMMNRQNQNFFDLGYITSCMPDRFHNLWLLSFSGLRKISFGTLSIRYFGVPDVLKNFSRVVFPDKKADLVITGSLFNQLSVFDTLGHLMKQFSIPPVTATKEVSCILKVGRNRYLVFADGSYPVYLLNTSAMTLTPMCKGLPVSYHPLAVYGDTAALLVQPKGIVKAVYSPRSIHLTTVLPTTAFCALLDKKRRLWIGDAGKYVIRDGKNFRDKEVFNLKENVITKCFYQDAERNVWLGTEEGLYQINAFNGNILRIYNKKSGLADENIYSVQEDNEGNIWCSTNKGLSCIYRNGRIVNVYASDGLQGNEFNTNVSAKAADGELYFGGINGVNGFYPGQIQIPQEKPLLLMQRINVMDVQWQSDTAAPYVRNITLPYTKNIIAFDFIALGHYAPEVYQYAYRMRGIDKNWVSSGTTGHARYRLPPGNYTFEYTAATSGGNNRSVKSVSVAITPLFWQTSWFKLALAAAAVALLWEVMYLYNKRKYQLKLQQLKIQQGIQRERQRISRDLHDNVGAYTTALAADAEELRRLTRKDELQNAAESISDNAKHIIASLQETIWVLNNDNINITELSDRLKVYSRKILKHQQGLQVRFQERIDADTVLSPGEALNVFRVLQEALHNALKHSGATMAIIETISDHTMTRISFRDNGGGFDLRRKSAGHGLDNMRHRCAEAGYRLHIDSGEEGTAIVLEKNHSFAV